MTHCACSTQHQRTSSTHCSILGRTGAERVHSSTQIRQELLQWRLTCSAACNAWLRGGPCTGSSWSPLATSALLAAAGGGALPPCRSLLDDPAQHSTGAALSAHVHATPLPLSLSLSHTGTHTHTHTHARKQHAHLHIHYDLRTCATSLQAYTRAHADAHTCAKHTHTSKIQIHEYVHYVKGCGEKCMQV